MAALEAAPHRRAPTILAIEAPFSTCGRRGRAVSPRFGQLRGGPRCASVTAPARRSPGSPKSSQHSSKAQLGTRSAELSNTVCQNSI